MMNAATLAVATIAAVDAVGPPLPGETMAAYRLRVETARAQALITHLATTMEVRAAGAVETGIPVAVGASTGATTAPGNVNCPAGSVS
jgi:hypothetical protein